MKKLSVKQGEKPPNYSISFNDWIAYIYIASKKASEKSQTI